MIRQAELQKQELERLDEEEFALKDLPSKKSMKKAMKKAMKDLKDGWIKMEKIIQDLKDGKITVEQAEELYAPFEDQLEAREKELADLGDVGPLMQGRFQNEMRMKIASGCIFPEFAKLLVGDAALAAARGTLESHWSKV